jgi:hypothetical protein
MDQYYVTANIVAQNNINSSTLNLPDDVFDIPDIMTIPAPAPVPVPVPVSAPVSVPVPVPVSVPVPAPAPVSVPIPIPAPAPVVSTLAPELIAVNIAKAINHNTMSDLMNQVVRNNNNNINNANKTPSVSTKMSEVSIKAPENFPPLSIPIQALHETTKKLPHKPATQGHRVMSSKVIIEDEDKDTVIDYDDDDPEIKKIKLSLFHFAKDITFNLIFTIPFLRTKLNSILKEPNLAINQIERVFDEFKDRLTRQQLESIKKYVCEEGVRDKLNYILESGFNKILSDGKIDINDAPQFNQLVYFIIRSFNNINQGKVYRFYVSREHVMLLLHFILKSVFTLTLKGDEEQMAIGLLDTSFKLVQLEVLPLISKRWYHRFRICHTVKEIEELIE